MSLRKDLSMRRNLILPFLTLTLLSSCNSASSSSTLSSLEEKEYEKVNVVNFDFSKIENVDPDNAIKQEDIISLLNSCSDVDYNLFADVKACEYVYAVNHKDDNGVSKNVLKFSTYENQSLKDGEISIDFADSITFNYAKVKYLTKYSDTNSSFGFGRTTIAIWTYSMDPESDGISEYNYSLREYSTLDLWSFRRVYIESIELALVKEKMKG